MGTKIRSIGYQFPPERITNERWSNEFATKTKIMSNEFTRYISEGVEQRFYMRPGDMVDELGAQAALDCLKRIDFPPSKVEHIIHMANVPDSFVNGEGPKIQHRIGAVNASTMDITGVSCSGFIVGLNLATSLIESGTYNNVLITNVSNVGTRAADHRDVSAATLGDLATAVLITKSDGPSGKLAYVHETRGDLYHVHVHKRVDDALRTWKEDEQRHWGKHFFWIDPREGVLVAKKGAHEYLPAAACVAAERAGVSFDDFRWLFTHQPGIALVRMWDKLTGIDEARHPDTLKEIGNSSFCTIPFTMRRTLDHNGIADGDNILLMSPGSGQHVAAMVWKW